MRSTFGIITCLRRTIFFGFKPVFMHDPIGFLSIWCSSFIEHKSFPHSYEPKFFIYSFVSPCSLPKPCHGCPIRSCPRWILFILVTEEIPLILLLVSDPTFLWKRTQIYVRITRPFSLLEKKLTEDENTVTIQVR